MEKNSPANIGDTRMIPGLGRSPGVGNGNPLWYSWWENSTDRGAWRAIVHGVAKSWPLLSTHTQAWNGPLCPIRNQLASRSWTRLFLLWFQKGEQRAICEHDRWVYFSIVVGRMFKTITVVQNSNEQWVTILLCLDIVRWSEIWWRTRALDSKGDFSFQSRFLWFK